MKAISMTSPASDVNLIQRPANFTRRTPDLAKKFWRNGQWHLIPLYHLVRFSDLAREGIECSGSYRFADHLYRNVASGRGPLGRWLDRRVLNSRAACAMRQRCIRSTDEILGALDRHHGPVRILALPCGIPRDILEAVRQNPEAAARIEYNGMDLDPTVLHAAQTSLAGVSLRHQEFVQGSALQSADFPTKSFDLILSTGLGEFLNDADLRCFYHNVFASLPEGGVFYTSATAYEGRSDYLLRAFELHTHYRTRGQIESLLRELPWSSLHLESDSTGLQTFVQAVR